MHFCNQTAQAIWIRIVYLITIAGNKTDFKQCPEKSRLVVLPKLSVLGRGSLPRDSFIVIQSVLKKSY